MVDKLAVRLTSLLCNGIYEEEKERARIQYGLHIIMDEGLKILFLTFLFHCIHYQNYYYFSLLILLSTRVFAGGVHVKGTLKCLILTTLLFLCTSVLSVKIPLLSASHYILLGLACFVVVLLKAPSCSIQRPIKNKKKRMQYKLAAALSVAIWSIVLLLFKSTPYINCGYSTLLLQSMQLVLVKQPK
jgi:accessory gene regulator B